MGENATFTLCEADEEELLAAMAEIEQGNFVTLEQLMLAGSAREVQVSHRLSPS